MGGMKFVPQGTFRKRASADKPPTWWDHYYRDPELGKTVHLGKSQRQPQHQVHRFYSVYGDISGPIRGWVKGVQWLLDAHLSARARNDTVTVSEDESVLRAKPTRTPR